MSKQDRQGVRTPADLERKYDLGQEAAAFKAASNAQNAAERAVLAVDSLDKELDREGMINRLSEGSGVIKSDDGTVQIDMTNNKVIVETLIGEAKGKFELSAAGLIGYTWDDGSEEYTQVLTIEPGGKVNGKTISWKAGSDGSYTLIGT